MKPSSIDAHQTIIPKGCCISRILRRILCFNSIPWHHPLDHQEHHIVQDDDNQKKDCSSFVMEASPRTNAPGLVARLMGLELLPHYNKEAAAAADDDENSLKLKLGNKGRKTIPTCQDLEEDDEFYTLRFGSSSNGADRRRKKRRSTKGSPIRSSNKENEGVRVWDDGGVLRRPLMNRNFSEQAADGIIQIQKKKKKKKKKEVKEAATAIATGGEESENSSPNSVLEFPAADHQSTASSGEISRLANSKMRRTLSDELENCGKPKEKNSKTRTQKCDYYFYAEEELIGKLAAMEMANSRWVIIQDEILKNDQCLKEIGRDVASDILDHLLDQLIINDFLVLE